MQVITIILLMIVVYTDLKAYRIKNWTLLLLLLFGIILQVYEQGWQGLGKGILSMLIPFGLLYPFYLMKTFGAGDIKLMSVIAVQMNPKTSLTFFVLTFLIGGFLAVIKMCVSKNGKERWQCLKRYVWKCFYMKSILAYQEHLPSETEDHKMVIHFSIPIVCSCLFWIIGCY